MKKILLKYLFFYCIYKIKYNDVQNAPVPEVAEQFASSSKLETALSLGYSFDGENYSNFNNLALLLRLTFDYSAYGEEVEETGLVLTLSKENAENFKVGDDVTYFEDENKDGEYVVKVEAGNDPASVLDLKFYVCGYVVVGGETYVSTVYEVSFRYMLNEYASGDGEAAAVASAALNSWGNAQ